MYGLKDGLDLSFLKDSEVVQVAIGIYQIHFAFTGDAVLSFESRFVYESNGEATEWRPGTNKAATAAVNLLGAMVAEIKTPDQKTLELFFSNGDLLRVFDESQEYESFTITRPGATIVV
jgi:hypothetical protein